MGPEIGRTLPPLESNKHGVCSRTSHMAPGRSQNKEAGRSYVSECSGRTEGESGEHSASLCHNMYKNGRSRFTREISSLDK